jgi:hypothetical protein
MPGVCWNPEKVFWLHGRVVMVALLLSFYLLARASTAWQTAHVAPGVECDVWPALYWWLALAAALGWGVVFVIAVIGGCPPSPRHVPCHLIPPEGLNMCG